MIKAYFISDAHLDTNSPNTSSFLTLLDEVEKDATHIFLLGDIFNLYFEYTHFVRKSFFPIYKKISDFVKKGIEVHLFPGNHDYWHQNFFSDMGVYIEKNNLVKQIGEKWFFLSHGDGITGEDKFYNFVKKIIHSRIAIKLFSIIHPEIGIKIGRWVAEKTAKKKISNEEKAEKLVKFARKICETGIDYVILGHIHLPLHRKFDNGGEFILIGDWKKHFSYAVFDGKKIIPKRWFNHNGK